ncbi:beta-1,6-N-acetylglucosaminyltransferase [Pantoea cypripedii]|uniref:beta-1,6-N-acetylglucosaminyltransferase n=1 Tax=Pantoea cypripedii TaxID=55209 RepID=UPI002FC8CF35
MKKIFCILCHKITNPLLYTVNYLSAFEENIILIHVDAKSPMDEFEVFTAKNIFFVRDRVDISWGGYSLVDSTIKTFNEALNFSFDYMFLISGDDLPCMTNQEINDLLSSIEMRNLIHYQDNRNTYVDPLLRVRYDYPHYFYKKNKSLPEKMKARIFRIVMPFYVSRRFKQDAHKVAQFYKGTNWISLNQRTLHALMAFINANDWYRDLFHHSFISDEVFFHTALKQIGVTDNYHDENKLNDALRYIDWTTGPDYPRTLDCSDLARIKASGCVFTRKISSGIPYEFFEKLIQ